MYNTRETKPQYIQLRQLSALGRSCIIYTSTHPCPAPTYFEVNPRYSVISTVNVVGGWGLGCMCVYTYVYTYVYI